MRISVILFGLLYALCVCAQPPIKIENFTTINKANFLKGHEKYEEAYKLLKPLADQGDLEAIYRLAELYDFGVTRPNAKQNPYYDTGNARKLLYIAAKQGHAVAQLGLGNNLKSTLNQYRDRPGKFRKIYREACDWYTKGAMQGTQLGTYPVARCYANGGFTGTRDYVLAYAWFAIPGFYQAKEGIYEDFDDTFFMNKAAKRGKLTTEQKQQAMKIAQDIAIKIMANIKKHKPVKSNK